MLRGQQQQHHHHHHGRRHQQSEKNSAKSTTETPAATENASEANDAILPVIDVNAASNIDVHRDQGPVESSATILQPRPALDTLADEVKGLLDETQLSQALEAIWQRIRRLNQYVEERAPWQQAKDPAQAGDLDVTLASLAEGLRIVTVLLHPYMPSSTEKLLAALGRPEVAFDEALPGGRGWTHLVAAIEPLFPKQAR